MPNKLAQEYEEEGMPNGVTVAEWEREHGLPPYSLYPWAKEASGPSDRGFFMYRNATEEELVAMRSRSQGRGQRGRNAKRHH